MPWCHFAILLRRRCGCLVIEVVVFRLAEPFPSISQTIRLDTSPASSTPFLSQRSQRTVLPSTRPRPPKRHLNHRIPFLLLYLPSLSIHTSRGSISPSDALQQLDTARRRAKSGNFLPLQTSPTLGREIRRPRSR